jgi:hypothetical protein
VSFEGQENVGVIETNFDWGLFGRLLFAFFCGGVTGMWLVHGYEWEADVLYLAFFVGIFVYACRYKVVKA